MRVHLRNARINVEEQLEAEKATGKDTLEANGASARPPRAKERTRSLEPAAARRR
jgi:hypothetical protein